MIKKIITCLLVLAVFLLNFEKISFVYAEDEIPNYCNPGDAYDEAACRKYLKDAGANIRDIEDQISAAEGDLEQAQALASQYAGQIDTLDVEITAVNKQIKELEDSIKALEDSINENQTKVDELNKRVLSRMEDSQKTMHFNPFLDFLLSATGFDDMLRRVYGIQSITNKDKKDREDLKELIEKLQKDKEELGKKKAELDEQKQVLVDKQAQFIIMRAYWLEIQEETYAMIEELQNSLEDAKREYSSIVNNIPDISGLPSSEGMTAPVPGASISAGVWHYPSSFGGGVHLGIDYAVGRGTTITAPMNGVVIVSSDSCPSTGYLGNGCPYDGSGVAAGGNQVIMIGTAIDSTGVSRVYGVSFFHMQSGSPTGTGVIMQGDYVGQVGSSGNSTGPHCHIELYYLGTGDMSDIQNDYLLRSYSLSFDCGWGSYGLNRLCEDGVGAPCRLNPSLYFGS